ncbi:hypothetical protein Taro_035684 [Colocasia esculenta]|uniref:Uncharacterized protein n=1 Tax=Colocasia esculenta TaxID=4460 RepID=A0A843WB74_COLES|nr:hypothetical protein [Colocasia esculenta]
MMLYTLVWPTLARLQDDSSFRLQQTNGEEDELLVVGFYDSIKASLTAWYILSSTWLVLQHRTVRNTVVTTSAFQARPELLPAFFRSVPQFIIEFAVFSQLPTFHFDSLVSSNISSGIRSLVVVFDVVVTKSSDTTKLSCPENYAEDISSNNSSRYSET